MGRKLLHNVYKKELLPPDGPELILDIKRTPELEGRTILDVIEERIKRSQVKLLTLQKKIKEATEKSRALEKDVLFEAKKEAEEIINQAQEKADELLIKAKTELEEITQTAQKEAHEKGFNAGKEEGIKAGEESVKKALAQVQDVLVEAKHKREEIIQTNQEIIIDLALMIAKKIIKTELATNKEAILKNLNQALKKVKDKEEIKVKVNPVHFQELGARKEEFLAQVSGIEGINFEEDKNIEPGGCIIETNFGLIDATISSQFEVIQEALGRR
ncbi:MAG: FliH/SctL family protein [bacterium]